MSMMAQDQLDNFFLDHIVLAVEAHHLTFLKHSTSISSAELAPQIS
jgi:hypothetical protein